MPLVINTNIASLNAQRNLNSSQEMLSTALERLSSGLRINSAKDDAAGLAISERFTAQIRGMNQAISNANDGISFAQTAEGALGEIGNALQRIRELSVQSANDTNSASDRQAINNEVSALISEVNRIANSTQFNGQNVLDGTLQDLVFQVGANEGQTITVNGVDARGSQLGAEVYEGTSFNTANIGSATNFTLNGEAVDLSGATDAAGVIAAINAVSSDSGVFAAQDSETSVDTGAFANSLTGTATATVTINGVGVTLNVGDGIDDLAAAINAVSGQTGVEASKDGGGTNIILTSSSGAAVEITDDAANVMATIGTTTETWEAGIVLTTDVDENIITGGSGLTNIGVGTTGTLTTTSDVLNDVNVLTQTSASEAIGTIDYALQQVNGLRAELGATQTRFESTIANLSTTSENLSSARSRIRDADFAAETAALTKAQILQQAGVSVLAQANAIPQTALSLLQ